VIAACLTMLLFPPWRQCPELELALRQYSEPAVVAPVSAPAQSNVPLHFILPTGHGEVSGWYFHDPRFGDGPVQHTGLDYACAEGDPIYAAAAGTVISAGWAGDFGNRVIIQHAGGWETRYCHLSRFAAWGWVHQGAVIGYCGITGLTTGAHLHFEARRGGILVDPLTLP